MKNEREMAEKLFGSVEVQKKAQSNELTFENLNELTAPLEEDEAIHVFCSGHHSVFSVTMTGRTELIKLAGVDTPADWRGKFFQVSGCPFCSDDGRFQDPILKNFQM